MNILVASDDSQFSDAAANAVIGRAKSNVTEVRLLHVLEPFPVALAEKMGSKDYPDFAVRV
jgi:nucleotide-binding universal stress UspA family protein